VRIGPAQAAQSYLDMDAVLEAARSTGADAIHPGYGFLSENAGFARACEGAGVRFVGPPASAIEAMGSKREALELMAAKSVPVLPGYRGTAQDDEALRRAAESVGFPLIIKPSAGGGGKGMQVARDASELAQLLPATRRVANAAFGDDTLVLERFLERPRHIEIQVFADTHGGCVHLFERDCSVQRRHQKVVEEAPAPGLSDALREHMGEVAVLAARAIGYSGAGTVEFLFDPHGEAFYFMEMNTRLQVEHPVTEMVTGIDLVEWQLRVAAGEPLPARQEQLRCRGHAIEVRLYAEDPERDFLPATGAVKWMHLPEHASLRVDSGIRAGDRVGVHYDPMVAKLIARGENRGAAIGTLAQGLARTQLGPLPTNLGFLRALAADPQWREGAVDTDFLARHQERLRPRAMARDDALLAGAAFVLATPRQGPPGPWRALHGTRVNLPPRHRLRLGTGDTQVDVTAEPRGDAASVHLPDGTREISALRIADGELRYVHAGRERRMGAHRNGDTLHLDAGDRTARVSVVDPATPAGADQMHGAGQLLAPMPGRVVSVNVATGERVTTGQVLVTLEAMKMEHSLAAPAAGEVQAVGCTEGAQVEEGTLLVSLVLD
jgi:3-methylcrotonyl-CoA carboxylase alpha subunit